MIPRLPVLAWVLMAVLAWGGWQRMQLMGAQSQLAEAAGQVAQANAAVEAAAESIRLAKQQEAVIREQAATLKRARADAAAAAGAHGRLLAQLDAIRAAGARDDSTATAVGQAASTAAAVLADVLGRCSERRRELAVYADDAREAGTACERIHDGLTRGN